MNSVNYYLFLLRTFLLTHDVCRVIISKQGGVILNKEEAIIIGKRIKELRTCPQIKLTMEKFGDCLEYVSSINIHEQDY